MQIIQESSQTEQQKKKSKQNIKFDYCLVYTNEEGQVHELTPEEIKKFRETFSEYQKLYQLMKNPEKLDSEPQPPERKFEKMANKIMTYFWKLESKLELSQIAFISMKQWIG